MGAAILEATKALSLNHQMSPIRTLRTSTNDELQRLRYIRMRKDSSRVKGAIAPR